MEREYEEAVQDIKAAIFDVVDSEKKTNSSLEDMIDNEMDNEKKETLNSILDQKKEVLDTILSNIDSIIDNVELLDKINYDNNLKTDYIKPRVEEANTDEREETDTEESIIPTEYNAVIPEETKERPEESGYEIEEPVIAVEETEDNNEEEIVEDNNTEIEVAEPEPIEGIENNNEEEIVEDNNTEIEVAEPEPVEEPVLTEIKPSPEKLAFNKNDKNSPRAIMIIKEQEQKLRDSCNSQLDKIKSIGLLDDYSYDNSTQNTIKGDLINEDIISKLNLEGKSIEDLTVLKQVYSDEGESEAVQAIEAKMAELSGEKDNNQIVEE